MDSGRRVTKVVTRHPIVSILLTSIPLIVLTFFYFDISTGLNDVNTFPDKSKTKEAFTVFEEEFSIGEVSAAGVLSPAEIVIDGNIGDPQVQQAGLRLVQYLQDDPDFPVPPQPQFNSQGDLALLSLPFPGEPNSRKATERLTRIREEYISAAFEGVPAEVYVGGVTAAATDFYGIVDVYTPIVFVFVLGLSFILLMLVFRSIAIPIKALIMNLLSVGATYGLLVLVFQKGVGIDLLGFQRAEVIDAWIPLFLGKLHTHNGGYPGRGGSDPKLHRLAYVSITGSVGLFSTRVLTPNLSGRERDLIGALKVSTTLSVLSVRSLQVWTGMLPLSEGAKHVGQSSRSFWWG